MYARFEVSSLNALLYYVYTSQCDQMHFKFCIVEKHCTEYHMTGDTVHKYFKYIKQSGGILNRNNTN